MRKQVAMTWSWLLVTLLLLAACAGVPAAPAAPSNTEATAEPAAAGEATPAETTAQESATGDIDLSTHVNSTGNGDWDLEFTNYDDPFTAGDHIVYLTSST